MRTVFTFVCVILCSGIFVSFHAPAEWKLQKHEQGISVYTRMAENSKFKELKSVTQYKASLSAVIAMINDRASYPNWVYRCGECKVIKKISATDLYQYQTVVAPWPVENRDFVVHYQLSQDPKTKVINIHSSCHPNFYPLQEKHVRIQEFRAQWIISPLPNGYVNVEYQLLVNPGGNIPAWLVNLAVVDGPFETALGMKEWIKKDIYQQAKLPYIVD